MPRPAPLDFEDECGSRPGANGDPPVAGSSRRQSTSQDTEQKPTCSFLRQAALGVTAGRRKILRLHLLPGGREGQRRPSPLPTLLHPSLPPHTPPHPLLSVLPDSRRKLRNNMNPVHPLSSD